MSTIQLDTERVKKYNDFLEQCDLLVGLFSNGDIVVKKMNSLLTEIRSSIDNDVETSWTKQDFNDILYMRNQILAPIIGNISFAAEFTPYTIE